MSKNSREWGQGAALGPVTQCGMLWEQERQRQLLGFLRAKAAWSRAVVQAVSMQRLFILIEGMREFVICSKLVVICD